MIKINLIFLFLLLTFCTQAQILKSLDGTLIEPGEMPHFQGCEKIEGTEEDKQKCTTEKLRKYIQHNLKIPNIIFSRIQVKRIAKISCIIEKDGSLTGCNIAEDPGDGFGEEALRLCQNMPKWAPIIRDGEPIMVQYIFAIDFGLDNILPDEQKKPISFLIKNNTVRPYTAFTTEGIIKIPPKSTMMASSRVRMETFLMDGKGRRLYLEITPELEFKKIDLKRTLSKKQIHIAKY